MAAKADSYRSAGPAWSRELQDVFTDLSVSIRSLRPVCILRTKIIHTTYHRRDILDFLENLEYYIFLILVTLKTFIF